MAPAEAVELSVIAPCLNEALNLRELAARLIAVFDRGGFHGEVVLVDDGSTDDTAAVIRELELEYPNRVSGVFHHSNRGIAEAWRSGAQHARGRLVATIDADLQYQPEDLLRLRRTLLESSVDIVQGFRSPVGRRRDERYTLSRGFNALLNGVFGMRLRDNKSGFVMCSREVFADLLSYRGRYFYWQSFIMVAAHAKGYAYKEIETLFEQRRQGTSFLAGAGAWKASAKSLVDLGHAAWAYHGVEAQPAPAPVPETGQRSARWRAYMATFNQTHWMITRDVERHYEALLRSQHLSTAALRDLQDERLRRLVRHAYRNVPYYRRRMQALGLTPDDIRSQADLAKLPLLTKSDIRENLYFDILAENHDKNQMLRVTTSGSTGEPFVCYADRRQLEVRWAATLRSQEWTGYRFGDPTVRLWHQTLGLTPDQAKRERLDAALSNRTFVPVFELGDANIRAALETIARVRPTLLDGYAEALDLLARHVESSAPSALHVGAVMTSAQTLPARSRALIEAAFGARVFDKYGSREFSGIAYECEAHDGHHVVAESYIVELLRDGEPAKPGELGEVVITDLHNTSLPFLRYRIGDLAIAMPELPCACGRGLPRIGDVEGRVQSIVRGANGAYLPGTFFAHYLRDFDYAIRRYQVLQDPDGSIRLLVVKAGRFSQSAMDEILETLHEVLGRETPITVQVVERLELTKTGKHVPVVSSAAVDFQRGAPAPADFVLRR
ncbi:MAG: glycosyltransferase [Polyangiaceae bacterium]